MGQNKPCQAGPALTIVKKSFPAANAAERNGRNAEKGGDVVLRHPPNEFGMLRQQGAVPTRRAVFDAGNKQVLVVEQPL
nr:hypothetical protein [Tanacetum cinerariifolium]